MYSFFLDSYVLWVTRSNFVQQFIFGRVKVIKGKHFSWVRSFSLPFIKNAKYNWIQLDKITIHDCSLFRNLLLELSVHGEVLISKPKINYTFAFKICYTAQDSLSHVIGWITFLLDFFRAAFQNECYRYPNNRYDCGITVLYPIQLTQPQEREEMLTRII